MNLKEVLQYFGLKTNDIKQRIRNGQIRLNGVVIKKDVEMNISAIYDAGDFLFDLLKTRKTNVKLFTIIDIEEFFGSNIDNYINRNFQLLRISKKEFLILQKQEI